MKYGYREIKKINASDIRSLCIKKNWYTNGTTEEYEMLLNYGFSHRTITTDELVEMATLILEYSEAEYIRDYEITSIMYELNEACYSYFEEVQEEK